MQYPDVLVRHIQSRISPPPPPHINTAIPNAQGEDKDASSEAQSKGSGGSDGRISEPHTASPFDMRNLKWMWTGLTFGKSSSAKSTAPSSPGLSSTPAPGQESRSRGGGTDVPDVKVEDVDVNQSQTPKMKVEIDTESLRDAITSENVHSPSSHPSSAFPTAPSTPSPVSAQIAESTTTTELDSPPLEDVVSQDELDNTSGGEDTKVENLPEITKPSVTEKSVEPPSFLSTTVYLAEHTTPTETKRKKVLHATVSTDSIPYHPFS